MGVVQATATIAASPADVMTVAQRVEEFPAFMPDVTGVSVLERDDSRGWSRVQWEAKVEVQSIRKMIRWVEDETWNLETRRCDFNQVSGDYKKYEGHWSFEPVEGGTAVTLVCDFDLGLPLVGALINRLLDKLMKDNCQAMLNAIKGRVEGA
ncbi:MAG: SRPBCC family protein [bacterium]